MPLSVYLLLMCYFLETKLEFNGILIGKLFHNFPKQKKKSAHAEIKSKLCEPNSTCEFMHIYATVTFASSSAFSFPLLIFCYYTLLNSGFVHTHRHETGARKHTSTHTVLAAVRFSKTFRLQREQSNSINSSCWEKGRPFPGAIHNI